MTIRNLNLAVLIFAVAAALVSCERSELDITFSDSDYSSNSAEHTPKLKDIIIKASIESHSGESTRTALGEDNSVVWSTGDAISVLYSQNEESGIKLIPYSDFESMAVGSSRRALITSVSHDGITFASTGTSWEAIHMFKGYAKYGKEITKDQAAANEEGMKVSMIDFYHQHRSSSVFTIHKVEIGTRANGNGNGKNPGSGTDPEPTPDTTPYFRIQNSSGNYLSASNASWVSSQSDGNLRFAHVESGTATSPLVLQNDNPSLIRIRNTADKMSLYASNPPTWTDQNPPGGWTMFYFYDCPEESNVQFTASSITNGGANASFQGSIDENAGTHYTLYPYKSSNYISEGNIWFSVPSQQTYAEGSFDGSVNPAVGILSENNRTVLKNLFGLLKLTLKSNDKLQVSSITVSDNNKVQNLWGNVTLPCEAVSNETYTCTLSGGSSSIVLKCNDVALTSEGKDFYFVVPVGAFATGLEIEVETNKGTYSRSTNVANTITRSNIKVMPTLTIKSDALEFQIENDIVFDWMNVSFGDNINFTYSAFNNGGFASRADNAFKNDIRTDHPKEINISWTGLSTSYLVKFESNEGYSYSENVTGYSYIFSGFKPNTAYEYTVLDSDGNEVANGGFRTIGKLRMVRIEEAGNIRDLGGRHTYSGKTLKYGKLFRGGHLDYISERSGNMLKAIGINAEADLRGTKQDTSQSYGDGSWAHDTDVSTIPDAEYQHFFMDAARDNPSGDPGMVKAVKWIMQQVASGKTAYFHCKVGADRTGQIAILLMGAIGVTIQDIEHDFETTSFGYEVSKSTGSLVFKRLIRDINSIYVQNLLNAVNACSGESFQDKCRYYLRDKFRSSHGISISDAEMDAFADAILE